MKKYIIGFISGVVISAMIFIPIFKSKQQEKYELGVNSGKISGLTYSVKEIAKEFGIMDSSAKYKRLYSIKTSDVVSVEINGVKTIRVIP
jgi:hypothetical protein